MRAVSAGPKGVALTLGGGGAKDTLKTVRKIAPGAEQKGDRLIVPLSTESGPERTAIIEKLLTALAD